MIKKLLFIFILFLFSSQVQADTYNWYFSTSGSGSTCSEESPCRWISSNEVGYTSGDTAQSMIDAANSDDTVNLYFKRGDTWYFDTDAVTTTSIFALDIQDDDPVVHIDAYGTGAKPKFDGTVTDFSAVPSHDSGSTPPLVAEMGQCLVGPCRWSIMINIDKDYSTIKNIHINGIYGRAISLGQDVRGSWPGTYADNVTIESCDITNFGWYAIGGNGNTGTSNSTITKNLVHTGQQLILYNKVVQTWWGAAIGPAGGVGGYRVGQDNTVSYNVLYNIAGEGIWGAYGTVEYNLIGDTSSVAIYHCPQDHDNAYDAIYRYNFITMSSANTYRDLPTQGSHGIGLADETAGIGNDNTGQTVQIYGNIIINREWGIYVANYKHETPYGDIKIFNNTIIDSEVANFVFQHVNDVVTGHGFIYNNASILYDNTSSKHVSSWDGYTGFSTYWTVDNNAFWTTGGSPTVPEAFRTGYVITDPLLAGETKSPPEDWDGQAAGDPRANTYFSDIIPGEGSSLINAGLDLSAWDDTLLRIGTDFSTLPTAQDFTTGEQQSYTSSEIGAAIAAGGTGSGTMYTGLGDSNVSETQVVSGLDDESNPLTIVVDLVGTTWAADIAGAGKAALIAAFVSDGSETHGWNNDVQSTLTVTRTSDTKATFGIPATATYNITDTEHISLTIPAGSTALGEAIPVLQTITIAAVASPSVSSSRSAVHGTGPGAVSIVHGRNN